MATVVIGIRKTAWQAANDTQRTILRWGMDKLDLGNPAEYRQPDDTRWFVFADWRITLEDVARLGTLMKGLAAFPNYQFPLDGDGNVDKAATKADIVTYVQNNWVDPATLTIPEDEEPSAFVLAAQGAPAAIRVGGKVPDAWTAVEPH